MNEVGISRDNHNSILGKNKKTKTHVCLLLYQLHLHSFSFLASTKRYWEEGVQFMIRRVSTQYMTWIKGWCYQVLSASSLLFFSLLFLFLLYPILFLHVISGPRHDLTLDFLFLLFASGKVNHHGLFSDWHNLTMPSLASFTKLWGQEGWLSKLGITLLLSKTQCSFPSFSSSFFFLRDQTCELKIQIKFYGYPLALREGFYFDFWRMVGWLYF